MQQLALDLEGRLETACRSISREGVLLLSHRVSTCEKEREVAPHRSEINQEVSDQ